ncbi:MAG: Clp protease N-terminal domain-containing protein, partial [Saprospiraceae bacterium]
MTYENFTMRAQDAILRAQQIASDLSQQVVDSAHVLKAIIDIDEQLCVFLFEKQGANISKIKQELDSEIKRTPKVSGSEKQFLSSDANQCLINAKNLLKEMGDDFISLEMLLLGILKNSDKASKILKDNKITFEGLKFGIIELRKGKKVTDASSDSTYNTLNKYAVNLNASAESGKLDPIIGRDEEIRRILHILSRRKKNNPILIGEAGVGKTAIIEGLAWRIVKNDVPENLKSKKIFSL